MTIFIPKFLFFFEAESVAANVPFIALSLFVLSRGKHYIKLVSIIPMYIFTFYYIFMYIYKPYIIFFVLNSYISGIMVYVSFCNFSSFFSIRFPVSFMLT